MFQSTASHTVRAMVQYSGYVQGVGFRYTTQSASRCFAVVGYVRNLPDGRVELVAEGRLEEIEGFLTAVAQRMEDQIHNVEREMTRPTGEFGSFEIRT